MIPRPPLRATFSLATLLICALGLGGCAGWRPVPPGGTPDRAFIAYWPPKEGDPALRVAVKDLIDMKDSVTSAGSEFLYKTSAPAKEDAACLAIARRRNVQFVGKTNTTELAVAVSGINEYFGTPRNPLGSGRDLIPGGSSCGSAVAVANGWADVALGTDTAGSIRVPAACCGVAGLKTTFGLVPLKGVYPIAPTRLDTVGPIARDVDHLVRGMDLLQEGFASRYLAAAALTQPRQITVGRLYVKGTEKRIDEAVDAVLKAQGVRIVVLDDEFVKAWEQAEADGDSIAAASAWLYDQKFRRESGVTLRTKAVVAIGEYKYRNTYKEAIRRQALWKRLVRQKLEEVDFIALPTLKKLPPPVPYIGGTPLFEARVLAMQNTVAVNLAGNPALALPIPVRHRNTPVTSLQLIGKHYGEAELLAFGRRIEMNE